MTKKGPLFCSNPFQWFEVSEGNEKADVFLCCPAWLRMSIGNLRHESVAEIWNGTKAQEIRRSILDGSFRYCDRDICPFLQTTTGPVQPIETVEDEDLLDVIERGLAILPYGPRKINCSYDKSCNLSCPSCRSNIVVETKNQQLIDEIQKKIELEALPGAHYLHITGSGDPFGSPFFRKWLQSMDLDHMPNLRRIRLQTNGQLWEPNLWETIPAGIRHLIKEADISIDAASPATYSRNRRGGSFSTLLRNLAFIRALHSTGPIEWVGISMVVQENNFMEMADFVALGLRHDFDTIYFSKLDNWGTFTEKEFSARAVHLRAHPKHASFLELLNHPLFQDPRVCLGNLAGLV